MVQGRNYSTLSQKRLIKESTTQSTLGAVACRPGGNETRRSLSNDNFALEDGSFYYRPSIEDNSYRPKDDDLIMSAKRAASDSIKEVSEKEEMDAELYCAELSQQAIMTDVTTADGSNSHLPESGTTTTTTDLPESSSQNDKIPSTKNRKGIILAVVSLVLIIVIIAIGLSVTYALNGSIIREENRSNNNNDTEVGNSGNNSEDDNNDSSNNNPAEEQVVDFIEILPEYTILALEDPSTSPQSLAFYWLQNDPSYDWYTNERRLTRFILATLFYATNGETSWRNKTNWLSFDVHECDWYSTTQLDLCEYLDLSNNGLDGFIPDEIGLLGRSFERLDFSSNENLRGTIPSQIGLLSGMESIHFEDCSLSGTLPTALFTTQLEELYLQNNSLVGTIPNEIRNLHAIEVLDISSNSLTGTIATEIGNLRELSILELSRNQLSGVLPLALQHLTNINRLSFGYNHIIGSIPSEYKTLTKLRNFLVSNNQLNGTLFSKNPEFLLQAWNELRSLDVSNNHFTSMIPTEIGYLTKMQHFQLHNNSLTGSIPTEIGQFKSISMFQVNHNQLNSTIPTEIGFMTQRTTSDYNAGLFQFNDNLLTGTIPSEIGLLSGRKQSLYLHNNRLSGSLPTTIGHLTRMTMFTIHNNQNVSGIIPSHVGLLTSLQVFSAHDNSLGGMLPTQLGQLTQLVNLWLNHNNFTGPIPSTLGYLTNLQSLHLHNNSLLAVNNNTTIPMEVCSLIEVGQLSDLKVDCDTTTSRCDECNCTTCV